MALQPYQSDDQALAIYQAGPIISPEEVKRRQNEAEELDKKLRHIVEEVPDRTYRIMGSGAGANSGDFHNYRHSRRREQERLQQIDEEAEMAEKDRERQEKLAKLDQEDEERTAKRRAKRQKRKANQKNKKQKVANGARVPAGAGEKEDNGGDSDNAEDA